MKIVYLCQLSHWISIKESTKLKAIVPNKTGRKTNQLCRIIASGFSTPTISSQLNTFQWNYLFPGRSTLGSQYSRFNRTIRYQDLVSQVKYVFAISIMQNILVLLNIKKLVFNKTIVPLEYRVSEMLLGRKKYNIKYVRFFQYKNNSVWWRITKTEAKLNFILNYVDNKSNKTWKHSGNSSTISSYWFGKSKR